jgi:hypothetical protein
MVIEGWRGPGDESTKCPASPSQLVFVALLFGFGGRQLPVATEDSRESTKWDQEVRGCQKNPMFEKGLVEGSRVFGVVKIELDI